MKPTRTILLIATTIACSGPGTSAQAAPFGEAVMAGGYMWPQGLFTEFADPGPTFFVRGTYHMPGAASLVGWLDMSYTQFRTNRSLADIRVPGYTGVSVRVNSEWAGAIHFGAQVGSPTAKGFFRPRAGAGVGFNLFRRDDDYEYYDAFGEIARYPGDDGLLLGRFGWRGIAGADLFFVPKWGIALDFIYDQVWNANGTSPSRYQGVTAGLVLPFTEF